MTVYISILLTGKFYYLWHGITVYVSNLELINCRFNQKKKLIVPETIRYKRYPLNYKLQKFKTTHKDTKR